MVWTLDDAVDDELVREVNFFLRAETIRTGELVVKTAIDGKYSPSPAERQTRGSNDRLSGRGMAIDGSNGLDAVAHVIFGEQLFDLAKAQREPTTEPNRLPNDSRREPASVAAGFCIALAAEPPDEPRASSA